MKKNNVVELEKQAELPPGYSLKTWQNNAVDVQDRMDLLLRNGGQGLLLVFLVLETQRMMPTRDIAL